MIGQPPMPTPQGPQGGPAPAPGPGPMMPGMGMLHGMGGVPPGPQPQGGPPVGLSANPPGKPFQCGTCQFFQQGRCGNPDQRLNGKPVQPVWCCNFYKNPQMQTLIP